MQMYRDEQMCVFLQRKKFQHMEKKPIILCDFDYFFFLLSKSNENFLFPIFDSSV